MEDDIKIIKLPENRSKKNIKKEKREKKITQNKLWIESISEECLTKENEITILNELIENKDNAQTKLLKKIIKEKIDGYKHQDVLKKKLNVEEFVTFTSILGILKRSCLECFYCKCHTLLFYKYAHDLSQWTLERIDNSIGHNDNNVEICCLKCNIKRRTMYYEKYKFTKQVVWEKID